MSLTKPIGQFKQICIHFLGFKLERETKRRFLDEAHAFILGYPILPSSNAPLVVWEGSHDIIRKNLQRFQRSKGLESLQDVDLTDVYHETRRQIFDTCERIELPAKPGEATMVHRLALHGISPWGQDPDDDGQRAILYFRPELPGGAKDWLSLA